MANDLPRNLPWPSVHLLLIKILGAGKLGGPISRFRAPTCSFSTSKRKIKIDSPRREGGRWETLAAWQSAVHVQPHIHQPNG